MRLKNKLLTLASIAVAGVALTFGLSCNEHELSPFSTSLVSGKKQVKDSGSARAVDIIFVVDNSNSMIEEQRGLDENFGKFLEKLIAANADFRLAAVDTSYDRNGLAKNFNVKADKNLLAAVTSNEEAISIQKECDAYFVGGKTWIQYSDFNKDSAEDKLKKVQNLFRCQALIGTEGSAVERGLATLHQSLAKEEKFKREGSLLAIVFVTDENDCSDHETVPVGVQSSGIVAACETGRNIEDSCIMTKFDTIRTDIVNGSQLLTASGQPITYKNETKTLREWCVEGTPTAREALTDCLAQKEECAAYDYIDCPMVDGIKVCKNNLDPRLTYYKAITALVEKSNRMLYKKERPEVYDGTGGFTPSQLIVEKEKMASADVIVASIINRDRGVRYDTTLPESWCGDAGSQSYRYQLFAEMFDNAPIYAPICCKNEVFVTSSSSLDDGQVCGQAAKPGENAAFGPVLGVIGKRIGEAVNTICADAAPVTCRPEDCNVLDGDSYTNVQRSKASAACTCTRGCNTQAYFGNSERAYYLCNEFKLSVGSMDASGTYSPFTIDSDYRVDYESNYCHARTGSPIQINLNKVETGQKLIIEYPKRVSSM